MLSVQIKYLDPDIPLPEYKTPGAVAFDIAVREETEIYPGEIKMVPTGLIVCVPDNHALIVASRSSNAKKGIVLANGIGLIDQDYCGPEDEIYLALHNIGKDVYTTKKGERLAQGMFVSFLKAEFKKRETIKNPTRGGFGTTG